MPLDLRRFIGEYWEEEALAEIHSRFPSLSVRHTGSTYNLPDLMIRKHGIGIECKNYCIQNDYAVDERDIRTQVIPKFKKYAFRQKILAYKRKVRILPEAWRLLHKNRFIVTFGIQALMERITKLLTTSSDAILHDKQLRTLLTNLVNSIIFILQLTKYRDKGCGEHPAILAHPPVDTMLTLQSRIHFLYRLKPHARTAIENRSLAPYRLS